MAASESFLSVSKVGGESWKGSWSEMQPEHAVGILAGDLLKNVLLSPGWSLLRTRKCTAKGGGQEKWLSVSDELAQAGFHDAPLEKDQMKVLYPAVAGPAHPGCSPWGAQLWLLFYMCGGRRPHPLRFLILFFSFFCLPRGDCFWVQQSSYIIEGSPDLHCEGRPLNPALCLLS